MAKLAYWPKTNDVSFCHSLPQMCVVGVIDRCDCWYGGELPIAVRGINKYYILIIFLIITIKISYGGWQK